MAVTYVRGGEKKPILGKSNEDNTPKITEEEKPQKKKKPIRKNTLQKGIEESIKGYHNLSDKELEEFIQPDEEKKDNPHHRLNDEQREARLVFIHRMLIRKVPPSEVRTMLGISSQMYYKLKEQLDKRMRLDVERVDLPYMIGDSLAFYDEVRSMALTMASSSAIKNPMVKVAAMNAALRAEMEKNEFLTRCGIYAPSVVEHVVRTIVATNPLTVTVDNESDTVLSDAESVTDSLVLMLKDYAKQQTSVGG